METFSLFFGASVYTTAHSLSIALYVLAVHSEITEKLRNEMKTHIKDVENMAYEDIEKLSYIKNVIKKIMRLYNTTQVIFFRDALTDLNKT